MSTAEKSLTELTHQVVDLLCREMGVAETLRFLSQFSIGTGNYTEDRDALVGHLTLEEIVAEAREIEATLNAEGGSRLLTNRT
jgi:hypothetical protein